MRILLVEDNELTAEVASSYLAWMGYRPDHAVGALAALALVGRADYDVILMDLQMPDIDGIEAARIIRAAYGDRHRPQIVALTANVMAGERERCLAAGLDDYLTKPIEAGVLQAALEIADGRRLGLCPAWRRSANREVEPAADGDPVLDAAVLRQMERLGDGAIVRMIGLMLQDAPDRLREIGAAAATGDAVALERAAHKFKGGCAAVGARRLERDCAAIVEAASRGDLAAAANRARGLGRGWEALRVELESLEKTAV